ATLFEYRDDARPFERIDLGAQAGVLADRHRHGPPILWLDERDVLGIDDVALAHDNGALHHVAQLADVAGPAMGRDRGTRGLGDRRWGAPEPARCIVNEALGEWTELVRALAQRWNADR